MPKTYRPTTPGLRGRVSPSFQGLTKKRPEKGLLRPLRQRAGRNFRGKITVRHRGGGHKRRLRLIDFKRDKFGALGVVAAIEYDPNRSAHIALIHYPDGDKRYILAPVGLAVGDTVASGPEAEVKVGNALPLQAIPTGTQVHNLELYPGRGGQLVRSAGNAAQLLAKEGEYGLVRLPSGEVRRVGIRCLATIGQVSNPEHAHLSLGKAGRSRHLGRRPTVRGSAMSPRDHPHGGGEGRSPVGMPGPKTPWGKPARGYRTRNNRRSDAFIVKRRGEK